MLHALLAALSALLAGCKTMAFGAASVSGAEGLDANTNTIS